MTASCVPGDTLVAPNATPEQPSPFIYRRLRTGNENLYERTMCVYPYRSTLARRIVSTLVG